MMLTLAAVPATLSGLAAPAQAATWVRPLETGVLGQRFTGSCGGCHRGVDIGAAKGTPIRAVSDGVVDQVMCNATLNGQPYSCDQDGSPAVLGCGWYVGINHNADGSATLYCHMIRRPSVVVGQVVNAGDVIGYVGSSGNSSEAHLHFQTHKPGPSTQDANTVDPVRFMADRGVDLGGGGGGSNPPPSGTYWVDTFDNAPGTATPGGIQTGTLYQGTSYVYCKQRGPNVQVGSSYNHWWMKTDLDSGNPWQNQYVSAYYLSRWGNDEAKDNSGTDLPVCKHWVDTFADAPGASTPGEARTGTLFKGTSYVFCKRWGPNVQVGGSYNHWWMKTDLDSGNPWQNQYVSAYYLSRWGNDEAKDNSGFDIPICW